MHNIQLMFIQFRTVESHKNIPLASELLIQSMEITLLDEVSFLALYYIPPVLYITTVRVYTILG